jgi:uncharacterized lipoprotein
LIVKPIVFVRSTLAATCAAVLLGGCSWFHHKDTTYYSKAQETKPLEVPPDLDTPVTSNELTVPTPGAPGSSATAAATSSASSASSAPPLMSPGGDSLHVADSVGHAWTRVGLALERAQVGTISERNESAHSYTLDVEGLKASAPAPAEHHWYSRIMHPFGGGGSSTSSTTVSGHLTVTVTADGDGARVDVSGASGDASAAEAARRVVSALRERLS